MAEKPIVLVIIDGFGHSENKIGNAVAMARKPFLDSFKNDYPFTFLQASGPGVGLEWGEAGNSETGHLSIGAGRIVKQYLSIINEAITNGSFFNNPRFLESMQGAKNPKSKLHLLGLLTSGSVHAHLKHLLALVEMAQAQGVPRTYLHLFMDGKDSGPKEGSVLLSKLYEGIKNYPSVKIATLLGRNFAMERNNDWAKTQTAYQLLVHGQGQPTGDIEKQLKTYYEQGVTDENIPPTVSADLPLPLISDQDSLIFFNFREDSMRQISRAFLDQDFVYFPRQLPSALQVLTMTKYFDHPEESFAFPPIKVKNNLAEWLAFNNKKQFHIAESEKYAHVTLFFNGLEERVYNGETDFFLESPHDLAKFPEMRSADIAERVGEELKRDFFDFFLINFANADLLSHLGNIQLVAKGIEMIDASIGYIYNEVKNKNGTLLIASDHGNAEALTYHLTGERETKHNSSPVPFYLVNEKYREKKLPDTTTGILPDIAPTVLNLMELPIPPEMTGKSLLANILR